MAHTSRSAIHAFDSEFRNLNRELKGLVSMAGDENLFHDVQESSNSLVRRTVGTLAIRSAAAVEQMINGITVRLWDDPFEWTLPEQLPSVLGLVGYFEEVEAARERGFACLKNDDDLQKQIPSPVDLRTLEQILTDTIDRSNQLMSEAKTLLSEFTASDAKR